MGRKSGGHGVLINVIGGVSPQGGTSVLSAISTSLLVAISCAAEESTCRETDNAEEGEWGGIEGG